VTDKTIQKTNLEYNATYTWQVEAVQSDGRTATSTERTFTTTEMYGAPEITLKTPNNLSTGQATSVTLTWEATPGEETNGARANNLTGYDVYFAKAGEGYGAPQRVTAKELTKSVLEYGTTYKWKVIAVQSDGKSAASGEWSFNTLGETYADPQINLTAPANGATDQATTVTLTWEATPGTQANAGERVVTLSGYRVYFGKSGEDYPAPQWVTGKTLQKTNLEYNAVYQWQVVAVQSDGRTATSTERTFTTAEMYGVPEIALKTPGNLSTGQATTVTLTWEATPGLEITGARAASLTGYDVYFAKAGEEYGTAERVTVKELQKSSLEYGTTYKWNVVAVQSDGKSAASGEWAFTTVGESYAAPQISLTSPINEATMVSLNPTLSLEATPGGQTNAGERAIAITSYDFYFSKTSEDYLAPENVTGKQLTKKNLEPWTEYKWKAVVHQSDGQQTTTPDATFLTAFTFLMGNTRNIPFPYAGDDEKPIHGVVFTYEFEIGSYEVTFDRYDAYLLATGQPTSTVDDNNWGRGDRPVINVSWEDAVRYCNWLSDQLGLPKAYSEITWELLDASGAVTTDITQVKGWRLPTEAEWEYAARGGQADITDGIEANDYMYAGSDTIDNVAWYLDNSGFQTNPVGGKNPNELGLYDMSGNAHEWCHDRYGGYTASIQTNPTGPNSGSSRVFRGGGWDTFEAWYCRLAIRNFCPPTSRFDFIGFRIARTVF
jgi:formylglycine-generating enzyme required for sulfatase activity